MVGLSTDKSNKKLNKKNKVHGKTMIKNLSKDLIAVINDQSEANSSFYNGKKRDIGTTEQAYKNP